jgi:LPXTG-motif cell wall-anchored protein
MSLGTRISRPLSVFAASAWIVAALGLGATAYADSGTAPDVPTASHHRDGTGAATGDSSDGAVAPTDEHAGHADQAGRADHTAGTSGDPSSPQPISTADDNSGGANGQCPEGPYCSTRDGSPSGNGNGAGLATGEPCAGCVGRADNKNPHGQMPDASDHNAGYECDTNHGIARTNPAHTGCVTPTECVPTEANPCVTPPECVPTEANPCVTPPECVPTEANPCGPAGTDVSPPMAQGGVLPPTAMTVPPTRALPNTGAPRGLAWLTAAATAGIVAGAGLLLRRRRLLTQCGEVDRLTR